MEFAGPLSHGEKCGPALAASIIRWRSADSDVAQGCSIGHLSATASPGSRVQVVVSSAAQPIAGEKALGRDC